MKICVYSIPDIVSGKHKIKDSRLDTLDSLAKAKKKTYIEIEAVAEDAAADSDVILVLKDNLTDLILADLDFVETRLSRAEQESEKALLSKLKSILEKEELLFGKEFNDEEKKALSVYGLLTFKPVVVIQQEELNDTNALLARCLKESGYISFFTTGERETRSWLVKEGTCAWEAAGCIHSDIQKGFIRAEIIGIDDFIACGGEAQAKQAGKMHLEAKDYIMRDGDVAFFRFNK
jgi:ribosome-binding ATPase YchF (GTP1/OBG family)